MKQELRRSGVWESTEEALGIVGDGFDDEGDGEVGEEDGGVWIRRGSGEELVTIRGDRSVEHETKLSNARAVTKSNLDGAQHVAPLSNIKAGGERDEVFLTTTADRMMDQEKRNVAARLQAPPS